jgi:hypothetical protein
MKKQRAPLSFSLGENKPTVIPSISEVATNIKSERSSARKSASREGRQFIAAHVLPEAAKQFKMLAVEKDRTTQSLLIEAINDLFAKYSKSRIADDQ